MSSLAKLLITGKEKGPKMAANKKKPAATGRKVGLFTFKIKVRHKRKEEEYYLCGVRASEIVVDARVCSTIFF